MSKIIVINAQPLLRWALRQLIDQDQSLECVGEAGTVNDAVSIVDRHRPKLAIVGLDFLDGTGFGLIKDLRVRQPEILILVYAAQEGNAYAEHCLGLGARGYVSSSQQTTELIQAIHQVIDGLVYLREDRYRALIPRLMESRENVAKPLTERLSASEFEVFHLVGEGLSSQDIAQRLHRSIKTIETYRARIKEKLGLENSIELAQFSIRCLRAPAMEPMVGPEESPSPQMIETGEAPVLEIQPPPREKQSLGRQILIVDDHSISRDPLAIILRQNGFRTTCAADGEEAINKIVEHDPDLVLLDLLMPQINGIRVLEFIRQTPRYMSMPVIVMTALTGGELIDRARQLNAKLIFKSQTKIDELLNAISLAIYGETAPSN